MYYIVVPLYTLSLICALVLVRRSWDGLVAFHLRGLARLRRLALRETWEAEQEAARFAELRRTS